MWVEKVVSAFCAFIDVSGKWPIYYQLYGAKGIDRFRPASILEFLKRLGGYGLLSYHVRSADRIIVKHHDNGFFANYLCVLDVLEKKKPNALVYVDWTLSGKEKHFRYGEVGHNVWDLIFEPLTPAGEFLEGEAQIVILNQRVNPFFISKGREHFENSKNFKKTLQKHSEIVSTHIKLSNVYVQKTVDKIHKEKMSGFYCIGVHKRLAHNDVADNQISGVVPTIQEFMQKTESLVSDAMAMGKSCVVFLATDDSEAVHLFTERFGEKLILQSGIKRANNLDETQQIHTQDWKRVSIQQAAEVMVDALLLGKCDELVHLSSNVSTAAAIFNPDIKHATMA